MMLQDTYDSPIGVLYMVTEGDCLVWLNFTPRDQVQIRKSSYSNIVKKALDDYFFHSQKIHELNIEPHGTPFQKGVYQALNHVPYGQTISYQMLAKRIGKPHAARAVGGALNKNPIMIFIPCHRVIGKNGHLTGFGGGLPAKQFLLALEAKSML